MTFIDIALAIGFVWFVLAIEWPTEEHDHPFHDDHMPESW